MASQNRSTAKRDELLAVATDLFLERGYNGVTVSAIVERAGGTKTNIYTHFGGKEGLFRAIIESLSQELLEPLTRIGISDLTPQEALTTFALQYLSVVLSEKTVGLHRLAIAESAKFPEIARIWHEAGPEAAYQELGRYIAQQQQVGRFKPGNPRRMAAQFLYMLLNDIHLQLMMRLTPPPNEQEIKGLIDETIETFLHGIVG